MEIELEEIERQLRGAKGVPSADKLIKYLRLMRDLRIRDSPTVARYGNILLRHFKSHLSEEELWTVHEQVAFAALDSHALQFAASVIQAINRRFPESVRAKRLQGMYYEAVGDYTHAEGIYRDLLGQDPANEMILKRMVALERSRGNVNAAIEALRKYLDTFANDKEGWEELAELYLEVQNYRQAAFCYEELLMHVPGNSSYYVRYADILYTTGGPTNYKTARSYYAKAIELTAGGSLRALFGVLACSAHITDKVALQDARSRAQIELPEVTSQALLRIYKQHAPDKLPFVEPILAKLLSGHGQGI
ncbi:hypothetical protein VOLCADRAFT_73964 [Volvox carteri f. nagariensis]|uniref:ER membrane protein complex subunit 2 n=1 Tax=Volvox carteri f. nagariensis TaxID=3068 RepID=D8TR20_VOLCA|nr:uncharacterized protein VOLCADRAFT_73964 [Volvox carteri f. nagariensis]EFJ50259.1 hypothetical protein VOLCADRAFT_73964 [Volvox carteri f. nagariensis]|eukprot:XP_002948879.1 hypothetical protein VOLCADRAFT_73964 [Volvox carteri f. nagariensis]